MPDTPDTHPLEVERPEKRAHLARFMFRCYRCGIEVAAHLRACGACAAHYRKQDERRTEAARG